MSTTLAPLPTFAEVQPHAILLKDYYVLYGHYFFGSSLPADFPQNLLKEFPNRSYKMQLKAAITSETAIVNNLEGIQNEYLKDYYTLYMHYAYSTPIPVGFPQSILNEFPSKNYKEQLKNAIAALQSEVNQEKAI